ncbi:hypothetical protein MHU86_2028 [Fragilaria crotonensis]|nr:hypothetical protein MHU86_2028 [Fragilaria crotonensis]
MDIPVMRAAMVRIGFSEQAAQALVEDQGIATLEEIRLLSDDEIESLCKVIRRPGGTIPPPAGAAAGAAQVQNPGVQVNLRAELNLKLLSFYLRHQVRVSRTVAVASVTLDNIRSIRELREFESTYKNPDDLPTINPKDWPKTMEAIDEYLRSVLGERKIPLAYVIRKNEDIAPDTETFPTVQDEMIGRAPHFSINAEGVRVPDPVYLVNREKVWDIVSRITRKEAAWTYVKPAQKTRDGRLAYQGIYAHYLGPQHVDNMATMAEDKLKNTVYNGKQRRWDFEKYVNVHKQQHSVLEGLTEHGHVGIDPRSKVRYLLDGIKTDKFDAVKTRIMSEERLRSDFDGCVTLYQDYIRQTSKTKSNPTVNISAMKTGGKRKFDTVEDRYYTKDEYASLTPEQKKDLASKRLKRGHKPGAKDSKVTKGKGGDNNRKPKEVIKNLRAVNRQMSQLAKQMKKTSVADDDSSGLFSKSTASSAGDQKKAKAGANRTNAALTRQKKVSIDESKK